MVVLVVVTGYLIAFAAIPLFLVLPHELAHALAALLSGAPQARIEVGAPSRRLRLRVGRLRLEVRPISGRRWVWYGRAHFDLGASGTAPRLCSLAAGPAASLACAAAYTWLSVGQGGVVRAALIWLAAAGAWTFAVTALPLRYGAFFGPAAGMPSDGRRIVDILRARHAVIEADGQV